MSTSCKRLPSCQGLVSRVKYSGSGWPALAMTPSVGARQDVGCQALMRVWLLGCLLTQTISRPPRPRAEWWQVGHLCMNAMGRG